MSPASSFLPQIDILSTMPYGVENPCVQLGLAVPAVFPPNSLCSPSALSAGVGWAAAKTLMLCDHWSTVAITSLCYQHCSQPYTSCYGENQLYSSQTQQRWLRKAWGISNGALRISHSLQRLKGIYCSISLFCRHSKHTIHWVLNMVILFWLEIFWDLTRSWIHSQLKKLCICLSQCYQHNVLVWWIWIAFNENTSLTK